MLGGVCARCWRVMGGILNFTVLAWTAGFQWWHSCDLTRTQNVSEYMLVLALCLVCTCAVKLLLIWVSVVQDINKRLSLPADMHLPESFLLKQSISPTLNGPINRRLRKSSLVCCALLTILCYFECSFYEHFIMWYYANSLSLSDLTLLVGRQEGHSACKN